MRVRGYLGMNLKCAVEPRYWAHYGEPAPGNYGVTACRLFGHEPGFKGEASEASDRANPEFPHQTLPIGFDRSVADA